MRKIRTIDDDEDVWTLAQYGIADIADAAHDLRDAAWNRGKPDDRQFLDRYE